MALAVAAPPSSAFVIPLSGPFCCLPLLRKVARPSPGFVFRCATFLRVVSHTNRDFLGDFGARDPFPAEVASGFCDRVLGNANTEHVVLVPNSISFGLADKACKPLSPGQRPLSLDEARACLRKIVGWRIIEGEAGLRLKCEWNVMDFAAGIKLINRIAAVAEAEGHHPDLHLVQSKTVALEISTHFIGGLSENDFILAAKIDKVKTSDLIKKTRIWA